MTASIFVCHPACSPCCGPWWTRWQRGCGLTKLRPYSPQQACRPSREPAVKMGMSSDSSRDIRILQEKISPNPKNNSKTKGREDAGRRPGHGCERSPTSAQEDARRRRGPGRCRACLTAFFVRSLRFRPQAQSRQARASRYEHPAPKAQDVLKDKPNRPRCAGRRAPNRA